MRKINNILWLGLGSILAYNIASSDTKTIDASVKCFKEEQKGNMTYPIKKQDPSVLGYVEGEVIVGFKYGKLNKREAQTLMEKIGYKFKREILDLAFVFEVPKGKELETADRIKGSQCLTEIIKYAEPNRILKIDPLSY